jgi:hypothetical protein
MPTLSWLTRDDDIRAAQRVPYRLLEESPALSAGDPATGNILIQGNNLDTLKALLPSSVDRPRIENAKLSRGFVSHASIMSVKMGDRFALRSMLWRRRSILATISGKKAS